MGKPALTALYLRLSREDDDTDSVSESIKNQQAFLEKFAQDNALPVAKIYIDDGYSGTNFDRPGFTAMLADIECGRINTVVTKDLSRLGRDYILTGHYLERYFPSHNVRYIAVNDSIDTQAAAAGSDMTPFRSVINDMYARDISQKVRTALNTRKQQGKFIGSSAPYGYAKDPVDKNHLVIDEDTACTVRRIFRLCLQGMRLLGIANLLSAEKIPTPSAAKGAAYTQKRFAGVWNEIMVGRILTNPTYIGNLTQNRARKISYKVDKKIALPQSEWVVVENTHEPIVSKEDFESVRSILQTRSYGGKRTAKEHLLTGIAFCADCGSPMTVVQESPTRSYLVCSGWKRHAKLRLCTSHCIRESAVISALQEQLRALAKHIDAALLLKECKAADSGAKLAEKHTAAMQRQLEGVKDTLVSLYKDKARGILSEEDYLFLSAKLKSEQQTLTEGLQSALHEQAAQNSTDALETALHSLLQFQQLDRAELVLLVERITIRQDKCIDIRFAFTQP